MKTLKHILTATALAAICTAAQAQDGITVSPDKACTGEAVTITINKSFEKFAYIDFGDRVENPNGFDTYSTGKELKHIYPKTGEYTITLFIDQLETAEATKTVSIADTPELSLEDNPTTALITATTSADATLEWMRNGEKISNSANTLYYLESGTYTVTASANGCSATQTVKVKYEKEADNVDTEIKVVNNVITPGVRDGINDVLFIEDVDNYTDPCVVKVFDKRGKLVYTNKKYTNTDGFQGLDDDGNELFAGTYYYVIQSQGKKGCTGYVDIIR
ncbi:MAG: gliding motility-associated C-terminal domain-containing protein [Bacteroidales bacterium]|nr:gliding motility-associated C-terminal domain-containing protein [Bacteroidales bacterium]